MISAMCYLRHLSIISHATILTALPIASFSLIVVVIRSPFIRPPPHRLVLLQQSKAFISTETTTESRY